MSPAALEKSARNSENCDLRLAQVPTTVEYTIQNFRRSGDTPCNIRALGQQLEDTADADARRPSTVLPSLACDFKSGILGLPGIP